MIGRHWPNTLTVLRLAAVPWVAWLLHRQEWGGAAALIAAAGVTDGLDGWLARRFGWQSWLGSWLDPIADKALVATCYVGLALTHPMFAWLALVVVLRDVVIVAGASAYRALVGPLHARPTWLGKVASPLQLLFVVGLLVCMWRQWPLAWTRLAAALVVAVTLASGIEYIVEWSRRARRAWPHREGQ